MNKTCFKQKNCTVNFWHFFVVTTECHLGSNATKNVMVMGLNLRWQGAWTKAVYTGGDEPICECTVKCTQGAQFCLIYPRCQSGVTNKKVPNF